MSRKSPTFRLRQEADGQWTCRVSDPRSSVARGADPNEAVATMQRVIADYREFVEHLHGRCGEGCRRCVEGDVKLKGAWEAKP